MKSDDDILSVLASWSSVDFQSDVQRWGGEVIEVQRHHATRVQVATAQSSSRQQRVNLHVPSCISPLTGIQVRDGMLVVDGL